MNDFQCQCCGACCRWPGIVRIDVSELAPAAKRLHISEQEFLDTYTRLAPDRRSLILTEQPDGACIFLTPENRCRLHPDKPLQCKTFPMKWEVSPRYRHQCKGLQQQSTPQPTTQDEGVDNQPPPCSIGLIHVLGHPDLAMDIQAHPEDSFVLNCANFCQLLSRLSIPYIYYGCQNSILPDGGTFVSTGKPVGKWTYGNRWHKIYNSRITNALKKNMHCDGRPELIMSMYGAAQSDISAFGLPVVEPMVGYDHCWAPYRVFPSYAHQHAIYSRCVEQTATTRFFDTVIPHFLDPAPYRPLEREDDYLLYIGRDDHGKGVDIAKECAEAAHIPLRCIHHGCRLPEKAVLLAKARAVLMPTLYVEPFGYVAAEAQLCGTPVICTDWGAFTETVRHGVDGFRCRTAAEFAQAIQLAPTLNREEIRRHALNTFTIDAVAPRYASYFDFVWKLHVNGGYYAPNAILPRG